MRRRSATTQGQIDRELIYNPWALQSQLKHLINSIMMSNT